MPRISAALARLEHALMHVSAAAMIAVMLVVVVDVVARYFFSSPLIFAYDLIGMYLVVLVFFFALPGTLHLHGHIAIDFFQPFMPARLRFAGEAIGYAAGTVVLALIAWKLGARAWVAFVNGDVTATTIPWPIWLSEAPAALGSALIALRCAYRCIGHVLSVIAGEAVVEIPPPHDKSLPGEVAE
ncbi:MAG: TRAP transporter small permease [Gemmatimonadales bacterium]|jgi:TRAP-type C4-dicarboxylate transport system permease small subunit|nr:TRAP transporter small permease [Gemmatimonadales bacterium]MEB2317167.1 TRAP transporter small permease [Pseudomonadota bacterium]